MSKNWQKIDIFFKKIAKNCNKKTKLPFLYSNGNFPEGQVHTQTMVHTWCCRPIIVSDSVTGVLYFSFIDRNAPYCNCVRKKTRDHLNNRSHFSILSQGKIKHKQYLSSRNFLFSYLSLAKKLLTTCMNLGISWIIYLFHEYQIPVYHQIWTTLIKVCL